ncbi:glycosyltransferase [Streptomyces sp. NBC_01142]|uniref:glycosyltransferase family 2 protein n=1 Tax=Streptomyces sp. NBC_01142 TaxID=2975865 RepID=UPI0022547F29|nr:glycosyltransferase [Streptomyces sp. NBC_01142]MCX4823047.1 glycosyltransferase [Streptomyces sp. NBC_01142]
MIKVSVVVPVYNAGRYLDDCAPSLLGQSLGPDTYEVIYVDDGSTDDSVGRLEKLAAEHSHVRIHTLRNSGWAGKPRNVGIELARGEYVHFVDQDDLLGTEALERMHDLAVRNRSDVVLGKVSSTMVRPKSVHKRTVESCTADNFQLMETLTPHKMFRREFLLQHGLRFPEGPWILEDMPFVIAAYLKAERISILGDYPCYYWLKRDDGGNNTGAMFSDRHDFFGNLRHAIRTVKEHTEPGERQNGMLHRLYRAEVLQRVSEGEVLNLDPEERQRRYEAARALAVEEFPPGVRDAFAAVTKLRATLLEQGRLDSLIALADRIRQVRAHTEVSAPRWQDGEFRAEVRLSLLRPDGEALVLVEQDGRLLLDPELLRDLPGVGDWEVEDPMSHAYAEFIVKDRDREDWWFPEGELDIRLEPLGEGRSRLVAAGTLRIDPLALAGGRPLQNGPHDVWAYFQLLGIGRQPRLGGQAADPGKGVGAAGPALVGASARIAIPYWTKGGQLAVDMDERLRRLGTELAAGGSKAVGERPRGGRASLPLSMTAATGTGPLALEVRIGTGAAARVVSAVVTAGVRCALSVADRIGLPDGQHPVTLLTATAPTAKTGQFATAVVRRGRVVRLRGPAAAAPRPRAARRIRRRLRRVLKRH